MNAFCIELLYIKYFFGSLFYIENIFLGPPFRSAPEPPRQNVIRVPPPRRKVSSLSLTITLVSGNRFDNRRTLTVCKHLLQRSSHIWHAPLRSERIKGVNPLAVSIFSGTSSAGKEGRFSPQKARQLPSAHKRQFKYAGKLHQFSTIFTF